MEKLYTCKEVSERYNVTVDTVWEWIKACKLPACTIGRQYRIKESDLLNFENRKTKNERT